MQLVRFGPPRYSQPETRHVIDHSAKAVRVLFENFGTGSEKTSTFWVELEWADIESAVESFAELDNVQAKRMQKAARLLTAIEEAIHPESAPP